jgi:hypothetical protein
VTPNKIRRAMKIRKANRSFYGTRKDRVEVVWPISARGHSQYDARQGAICRGLP